MVLAWSLSLFQHWSEDIFLPFSLTFPCQVVSIPGAPLWAFLFFLMLLVIGVSSQFCAVEGLVTGIVDNWADMLTPHRRMVTLLLCALMFLLGLPMCTHVRLLYGYVLLSCACCRAVCMCSPCWIPTPVLGHPCYWSVYSSPWSLAGCVAWSAALVVWCWEASMSCVAPLQLGFDMPLLQVV